MTTWTPERIIDLKKLWSLGEPASAIAALLGGLTRNAIIGKAHRLGLSKPLSPTARLSTTNAPSSQPRRTPRSSSAKTRAARSSTREPLLGAKRVSALPPLDPLFLETPPRRGELQPSQCCWPEGDPRRSDFHFCGRNKLPGRPYCAHHHARSKP